MFEKDFLPERSGIFVGPKCCRTELLFSRPYEQPRNKERAPVFCLRSVQTIRRKLADASQAQKKEGDTHAMTNTVIATVEHTGRDRAIVMGGSIAGLAAARVLSDHFREVVLVERDQFGAVGEHRRGVPQGRHTHGLLAGGLRALEGFFPGLFEEARRAGGLEVNLTRDAYWCYEGGEYRRFASDLEGLLLSRPLLEGIIRERVRRVPNVHVWDGCHVEGLISSSDNRRVTGIKIYGEKAARTVQANLVIDATGRGSNSPIWLEAMGYRKPKEDRIAVNTAYVTRHFLRTADDLNGASLASIPATPKNKHGGIILAQEGNRWVVTLSARSGERVPTDLRQFIEFARTLSAPYVYNVICRAQAIGEPQAARFPASVRRRYEHMSRFPEGFLVLGDAICSFNPIYGQGMTIAALEALVLRDCLRRGARNLPQRFFRGAAKEIRKAWQTAVGSDLALPEVAGKRSLTVRISNAYLERVIRAARSDAHVCEQFLKVTGMLDAPTHLLRPTIMIRVAVANGLLARRKPAD